MSEEVAVKQSSKNGKRPTAGQSTVVSVEDSRVERSSATNVPKSGKEPQENGTPSRLKRLPGMIVIPRISMSLVLISVAFVLQLILSAYIISLICRAHGMELVFSISFLLLNLISAFWSFEVLLDRSKKLLIVSSCFSVAIFMLSMILLFVLVSKDNEQLEKSEKVAAFTILVQFLNVLAIMHCAYEIYYKQPAETNDAEKSNKQLNPVVPVNPGQKSDPSNKVAPIRNEKEDPSAADSNISAKTTREGRSAAPSSAVQTSTVASPEKKTATAPQEAIRTNSATTAPTLATAKEARQMRYFVNSSPTAKTSNMSVNSLGAARI